MDFTGRSQYTLLHMLPELNYFSQLSISNGPWPDTPEFAINYYGRIAAWYVYLYTMF